MCVNIMSTNVYRLVFQDPSMKKPAPSSLEIEPYTTDTVKIVRTCMFYLVHPDTKKLMDVTFFVAVNDGSMLLSCKTTLMLGLIQPRRRLDYLLPRASLITGSADHPKKLSQHCVFKNRRCPLKDLHMKWPLKCQNTNMQFPSWSQAKNRFCMNTLISLKGLVASQDLLIIYILIQVLPLSKLLAAQFLSGSKNYLNKK